MKCSAIWLCCCWLSHKWVKISTVVALVLLLLLVSVFHVKYVRLVVQLSSQTGEDWRPLLLARAIWSRATVAMVCSGECWKWQCYVLLGSKASIVVVCLEKEKQMNNDLLFIYTKKKHSPINALFEWEVWCFPQEIRYLTAEHEKQNQTKRARGLGSGFVYHLNQLKHAN